jgi:cytidylate kinase
MLVVLIGPKGSGKSFVGSLLQDRFGIKFLLVEPLWKAFFERGMSSGTTPSISEGIAEIHPVIRRALADAHHLAVETTGASEEILADLLSLVPREETLIIRINAPVELCSSRILTRSGAAHIPADEALVRKVHALSELAPVSPDIELSNIDVSADELALELTHELRKFGLRPLRSAALYLPTHRSGK